MRPFFHAFLFILLASQPILAQQTQLQRSYYAKTQQLAPRDFTRPLAPKEAEDIRFIITTLADKPIVKLWLYKPALDNAGDRIQHVHPLQFLGCIFGDEQMKVAIRNIRRKSIAWDGFIDGVKRTLDEESKHANVTTEQVEIFAQRLGIDVNIIQHTFDKSDWVALVDLLIQHVPRQGNSGRYDM